MRTCKLELLLLICSSLLSCVPYVEVDYFSRFRIEGTVKNEIGDSLEVVDIYFIDISLDQWVANRRREVYIGSTDADGNFSAFALGAPASSRLVGETHV